MKKTFIFLLIAIIAFLAFWLVGKDKTPTEIPNEPITLVNGTYCYHRSQLATIEAPYAVEENIKLIVNGNNVTGTKNGTQAGPDMTNGYDGTLIGTRDGENIEVVFSFTIEGSQNKEKEIYKWSPNELQKLRYVLKDEANMLVPDLSSAPSVITYEYVPCENQTKNYTDPNYGIYFNYPISWGAPVARPNNKTCPEEDTYRTVDTVNVFDREIAFPEIKLPGSESFIRIGIRLYELDPKNQNDCGDELFVGLVSGEIDGRTLSSVRLTPVDFTFAGYYNEEASRLNTEGREQYILATLAKNPERYLIIQPYLSFIPYFGSPELAELDGVFQGDMQKYLAEGQTARPIREYAKAFRHLVAGIRLSVD